MKRYLIIFTLAGCAWSQQLGTDTAANSGHITVTANSTGVTANLLATVDSTNPNNYQTVATGASCKAMGVAGSTVTSATFELFSLPGLMITGVADNAVTAGNLLGCGTTTAGRVRDLGQTDAGSVDSKTMIIGRAEANATTAATVLFRYFGQGSYGTQLTNEVTAASAATAAKQTCVSNSTDKTCNYIDFPERYFIPAANCNNATAGAGWSIGSGGTVTCRAGTNNLGGFIVITDTSTTFATFQVPIPEDWDSAANPYIRFQIASTDTTTGHTIIPSIQVACYKGDGTTTDDVAANAAHSSSTVTLNTTANQFWSNSNVQMNSTDMTGCVAGAIMQVTVGRATDTATNARFYGASITFPRLLTVGAQ